MDFSDYVSGKIFCLVSKDRLLYLITFIFKNKDILKCNCKIYNINLLAIIQCFKQLRSKLKNSGISTKIIIDYKNL